MREFYSKYYWGIKKFVSKKIDDEDVVEEITSDVIWAAWEAQENFKHESNEFSWICGIAKHKIVDYFRKKKLKTVLFSVSPIFEEIADEALTPEKDCLKNELIEEVRKSLKSLKDNYKNILTLKYLKGLAVNEIAAQSGKSHKSIESMLGRARLALREIWNNENN
jgi:RNA polymerase sigma-70 factor, ECF subfamily